MSFTNIADKIVSDSIRSAICIDDNFLEPYEVKNGANNTLDEETPRGLYNDFKQSGKCSLDVYRFISTENAKTNIDFILKNRDLLILDWELNTVEPKYSGTLDIIKAAVEFESLHFICIYTQTPEANFGSDIIHRIAAFFSGYTRIQLEEKYNNLVKELHDDWENVDSDLKSLKPLLLDFFFNPEKEVEIIEDVKKNIVAINNEEIFKKFQTSIQREFKGNLKKCYENLSYYLNSEINDGSKKEYKILGNNADTIIINNTIIKVLSKNIQPTELYSTLRTALMEGAGNFLTLMSLEMRNMLKDSSAFMKSFIDQIDELAFFYHQQNAKPPEEFYEFLKNIWKEEAVSIFIANEPSIFSVLDDYKSSKEIDKTLKLLDLNNLDFQKNLSKLNFLYNRLDLKRPDDDKIRFGDIFAIKEAQYHDSKITRYNKTDRFLICITPSCDCLYSEENINNNFHFVKGLLKSTPEILKDGDAGFNSYIKIEDNIACVHWLTQPFTIYIKEETNKVNKSANIKCVHEGKDVELVYISTQKENYTQRLANKSFGQPLRVGINFAGIKQLKDGTPEKESFNKVVSG